MAGLVESFKKVFEDKKAHIWIFVIALVWAVLSNLCDAAIGKVNNLKQNPFDFFFSFLIGMYSIQFLHNSIVGFGEFPSFKSIDWRALPGLIGLNIVWGLYAVVILFLSVILFMVSHTWVFSVILFLLILLVSPFVYYIYLAYAEDFVLKGLFDIRLIFGFMKAAIKETYIKVLLFSLVTILVAVVFVVIYMFAEYFGFDKFGHIAGDLYALDVIVFAVMGYLAIVIWYFAFPYSLISTYMDKVRTSIKGVL